MKKTHIASLFESIKTGGGVEKMQANISIGLTDLGYDFTHLLMNDMCPRNEYKGKIHNFNMKFIVGFGIKKILSLFLLSWKVIRYCKENKVDVLIGQGDFFFMVTGLSKILGNKSKCIALVHTSIGVWSTPIIYIMRFFIGYNNYVVMTSKQEMQTFIEKYQFNANKVSLVYNAVDALKIIDQSKDKIEIKYNHIFTNGRKTFINIARLNYQKNQELLIKSFSAIKDKETQLIIVGEGTEREALEKLIIRFGLQKRIFLIGNPTNPHQFVSRSDYWILSSRFEGFPVALIEGGILGKAIISLDCPTGPREFLDPLGKISAIKDNFVCVDNGILVKFDNNSIKHLTKAMEYILTTNMKPLQNNVQQYCKIFNNKDNAKKRDMIIQSLV